MHVTSRKSNRVPLHPQNVFISCDLQQVKLFAQQNLKHFSHITYFTLKINNNLVRKKKKKNKNKKKKKKKKKQKKKKKKKQKKKFVQYYTSIILRFGTLRNTVLMYCGCHDISTYFWRSALLTATREPRSQMPSNFPSTELKPLIKDITHTMLQQTSP